MPTVRLSEDDMYITTRRSLVHHMPPQTPLLSAEAKKTAATATRAPLSYIRWNNPQVSIQPSEGHTWNVEPNTYRKFDMQNTLQNRGTSPHSQIHNGFSPDIVQACRNVFHVFISYTATSKSPDQNRMSPGSRLALLELR